MLDAGTNAYVGLTDGLSKPFEHSQTIYSLFRRMYPCFPEFSSPGCWLFYFCMRVTMVWYSIKAVARIHKNNAEHDGALTALIFAIFFYVSISPFWFVRMCCKQAPGAPKAEATEVSEENKNGVIYWFCCSDVASTLLQLYALYKSLEFEYSLGNSPWDINERIQAFLMCGMLFPQLLAMCSAMFLTMTEQTPRNVLPVFFLGYYSVIVVFTFQILIEDELTNTWYKYFVIMGGVCTSLAIALGYIFFGNSCPLMCTKEHMLNDYV
jgi:hypothetical protein